jgi:Ion channel
MNTAIATQGSGTTRLSNSHRFGILLASQVALIVIHPWGDTHGDHPGWFGIFALAVMLAGLYQVAEHRRIRRIATLLCALAVAGNALSLTDYKGVLSIPVGICSIVFIAFITATLLQSVISSRRVTSDTLYGAVSAYLFIGILWGMSYSLVDSLSPGSFHVVAEAGRRLAWTDYIFFSFVTLTTVGYGDIVPIGAIRGLVMLEGIIGAMYPAILIGRLLTLYRPSRET